MPIYDYLNDGNNTLRCYKCLQPMNTLCIDIGNSRTKIGLFDPQGTLLATAIFNSISPNDLTAICQQYAISQVILSSVAKDQTILSYLHAQKHLKTRVLDHTTRLPFKNEYQSPQTLGKDRLASVAGAHYLYPQKNVLVIDAGTCIKFDLIDQYAHYYGGSIAPGINMRFKALHQFTDRLPLLHVELQNVDFALPPLIGKNTQEAILSGVLNGTIAECSQIINQYQIVYSDNLLILISGGDASFLYNSLKPSTIIAPHLLLYGLYHLSNYQVSSSL